MSENKATFRVLKALAYFGVALSGFPIAMLFDCQGYERYSFADIAAVYGCWIVFGGFGILMAEFFRQIREKKKRGRRMLAFLEFLRKSAFLIPTAGFIVFCVLMKVTPLAYLYIMPVGAVYYFGCANSSGKGYSDVFTKGWFLFFLFSALFALAMLAFRKDEDIKSIGNTLLCVSFGVMIMLAAVLSNQTNIDENTRRRGRGSKGKNILPYGMRGYNAIFVAGIFAVTLGLFVFAKPLGAAVVGLFAAIFKGVFRLFYAIAGLFSGESASTNSSSEPGGVGELEASPNLFATIVTILALAAVLVFVIKFRHDIILAIRHWFSALFRRRKISKDTPFSDEIIESDKKLVTHRMRRKAERDLARQYRRENDPRRKYRLGYAMFLNVLRNTEAPPVPSDTCADHREKGERVFDEDLSELTEVYGSVRYSDCEPTNEQLSGQEQLLMRIAQNR